MNIYILYIDIYSISIYSISISIYSNIYEYTIELIHAMRWTEKGMIQSERSAFILNSLVDLKTLRLLVVGVPLGSGIHSRKSAKSLVGVL